jgi:LacI family transcriptional regulator
LARHLFDSGHERIAMLGISHGRPGDHDFLDGIVEAMTAAGKPPNSLIARLCPNDLDTLRVQAEATLSRTDRPTGVVCRGERMLNLILPIASRLGLRVPEELQLVYETFSTEHLDRMPFPCVQTSEPFEKIASQICTMLRRIHAGGALEQTHIKIPVELRTASFSAQSN